MTTRMFTEIAERLVCSPQIVHVVFFQCFLVVHAALLETLGLQERQVLRA